MNSHDKLSILKSLLNIELKHEPFTYGVIDNFLPHDLAKNLAKEFPDFNDEVWFNYKNQIEDKKLLSDWRKFPKETYQIFSFLNSNLILETLSTIIGTKLQEDHGLHGGGWHIHANGGKLNPHLDYSLHPSLKLQRKLNLIVYLCEDWKEEYGGHFGLWNCDPETKRAGKLHTELPVAFNRAVIFDTTQGSWHGLSREVSCPNDKYRKSLAVYYLCEPPVNADSRSRALFAATEEQQDNKEIKELIQKRSVESSAKNVYVQKYNNPTSTDKPVYVQP
jgi:Rps23 Pro-64 3,4-dihydroxylase Tpa1-like proline 4-hydroxylase